MFFNSLSYFLFLPAVWVIFVLVGDRFRWLVLLLAGIGFYAALRAPYLLLVLGVVVTTTYGVGLRLGRSDEAGIRKMLLWTGILVNLLVLVSLKYLPPLVSTLLPLHVTFITIGVSYYVFQAISYLIDIYLEITEPEEHFGYCALYLSFFPKLLQGPIERAGDLLPQLKQPYRFDYDNMRAGLILFAWGLFKKVVVADRLAFFSNAVYNDIHSFTGISYVFATYCYALQIYMDFSGYTDMALGSARMFNISLTQNFNSPYRATSIADFWRRWHISFSRWILDYIFKPLQMQWRGWGTWGTAFALVITFLVSGVWHGARWGYVVWGLLHGVYLALSVFYKPYQKKLHKALHLEKSWWLSAWQTLITFNLVCFAWIFFRANSLADAAFIVRHLHTGFYDFAVKLAASGAALGSGNQILRPILVGQSPVELGIAIVMVALVVAVQAFARNQRVAALFFTWVRPLRWSFYYALTCMIMVFGVFNATAPFIYFNF
jgi:D-alanyl-lipoteichoic acid acyltransferase DltB (MBOAT superfamily)